MANNTLLASDSFASGSLAAGWTNIFGVLKGQVVGSGAAAVVEPNSNVTSAGQIWNGLVWPSDQTSEITITNLSGAASTISLQVRLATGSVSGYQVNINVTAVQASNSVILYKLTNGSAVQLGSSVTNLAYAAGDIWSMTAWGPTIIVYRNYKWILQWTDTTYTSGYPGFSEVSTAALTDCRVASWRGYNAVQQDGIWTKQGAALISILSTDINTGVAFTNSGLNSASKILYEGNAQVLSGIVYKQLIGTASGIQLAESTDGINWTRYASTVLANKTFPQWIKSGSTYYLYCQRDDVAVGSTAIQLYTSTDTINWAQQSTTVLSSGAGGTWDAGNIYLFSPVDIVAGTWRALYSGVDAVTGTTFGMGLATSSDGVTWAKYGSNPVANRAWASFPYLINGVYYLWASGVPPGVDAGTLDPSPTERMQSTDLITWTGRTPSLHNSELGEGVNNITGFAYATALISIGNTTYMYYEAGPTNSVSTTGSSWNLSYATAPATINQIITANENALQQVATDAFTSGAGDLSANWTLMPTTTKCKIIAGPLVEPTATGVLSGELYTGASFGNDQYSQVTLNFLLNSSCFCILAVRASLVTLTQYEFVIVGPTGTRQTAASYIYKRLAAGGSAQLSPFVIFTPTAADVFTLTVIGNVLSVYQNGWLISQAQDVANSITSGVPGFWLDASASLVNAQISNWAGGNANVIPTYPTTGNAGSLSLRRRKRRDVIS